MATKAAAAAEIGQERDDASKDGPLMDNIDQAVKNLIKRGKERGYLTYDEVNAALPQEEMSSEQIEDVMSALNEMGVNVVEGEENDDGEEAKAPRIRKATPAATSTTTTLGGPTIRCACICAKWAALNCCRARVKSPSPSGLRRAVR